MTELHVCQVCMRPLVGAESHRCAGTFVDTEWKSRALCAKHPNPDLWHPDQGEHGKGQVKQAKAICKECPVKQECLEYALQFWDLFGIWGGMTEMERRRLRAKRRRRRVA